MLIFVELRRPRKQNAVRAYVFLLCFFECSLDCCAEAARKAFSNIHNKTCATYGSIDFLKECVVFISNPYQS